MTRVQVEIEDFVDAANIMWDDLAQPVRSSAGRLSTTLDGCAAMAGDDDGGRSWAASYDQAARTIVAATNGYAAAAVQTAALFGRSANNYAAAEQASTTGTPSAPRQVWSLGSIELPALPPPPSAAGADDGSDEPALWHLVKDLVGYLWPNGHQDTLRRAAAAYRSCAQTLETASGQPMLAGIPFTVDRLPEADDIATVCRGLSTRANDLADMHHQLAGSCDQLAHHIDHCHSEIESALADLAIESAVIQGAGAILAALTLGAAEAPTQVVQATRIAAVAARITDIIRRFITTARVLETTTHHIAQAATTIKRSLDELAAARLVYAGATHVPALSRTAHMTSKANEAAAAGRIAQSAKKVAQVPSRLVGRRAGEPGVWSDRRTLAEHFAKHATKVGAKSEADYVAKASDFLQRALREGLPRRVDGKGNIRVYDPVTGLFGSFRADGAARTFFKPTSPTYFDRQPGVLQ